jgi:hypothetical protein
MASKKRVVLDLNGKVKVIEASKKDKLTVKQIVGKTQAYKILKSELDIKHEWLTGNGSMKRKLKTGNKDINEIVWHWFISARALVVDIYRPGYWGCLGETVCG